MSAGGGAMPLELADIRKLKAELRRDLDALDRLETLITMRQNPNGSPKRTMAIPEDAAHKPSLNDTVIDVLRQSKKPLRPSAIVQLVADRGYPFGSLRKGMGSVTKVLVRQKGKTVEKQADGTYVIKR
jgi:hypothetical protein